MKQGYIGYQLDEEHESAQDHTLRRVILEELQDL